MSQPGLYSFGKSPHPSYQSFRKRKLLPWLWLPTNPQQNQQRWKAQKMWTHLSALTSRSVRSGSAASLLLAARRSNRSFCQIVVLFFATDVEKRAFFRCFSNRSADKRAQITSTTSRRLGFRFRAGCHAGVQVESIKAPNISLSPIGLQYIPVMINQDIVTDLTLTNPLTAFEEKPP